MTKTGLILFLLFSFQTSIGQIRYEDFNLKINEYSYEDWNILDKSMMNKISDSLLKIKPIQFLRFLASTTNVKNSNVISNLKHKRHPTTVAFHFSVTPNWITRSDVDTLIRYVKSHQIAHMSYSILSSMYSPQQSTVGFEAMHLIGLYRFPDISYPSLCYICTRSDQEKLAEEYILWWKELDQ